MVRKGNSLSGHVRILHGSAKGPETKSFGQFFPLMASGFYINGTANTNLDMENSDIIQFREHLYIYIFFIFATQYRLILLEFVP